MKSSNAKKIFVEVAKTPDQVSRGLMFRKSLDKDSGMLFVFDHPKPLSFWGMNTFMPLDIAFIDEGGTIRDIKRIKEHDLTSVKSSCPCKYALEIEDGWFKSNGFSVGDYCEPLLKKFDNSIIIIKNIKTAQKEEETEKEEENIIDKKEEIAEQKTKPDIKKPLAPVKQEPKIVAPAAIPAQQSILNIPKFGSIFEALRWSMGNSQVMRITYHTEKGHTVTKDIEPHRIFFSRNSKRQVLKAYDETADHPSQYIVMNIVSYGFPGRKFLPKSILLTRR
jgi:uncharacterized membrane protein (UPF0127 family)